LNNEMSGQETRSLMSQHSRWQKPPLRWKPLEQPSIPYVTKIMSLLEAAMLPTDEQRSRYRCIAAFAGKLLFAAANAIWDAEGARAAYMKNHIARAYRDLCTATRHFTHDWDVNATTYGRVKLGLPLDNPFFVMKSVRPLPGNEAK
jgi:hypothetical protein